jgi:hypothetical protein
MVTPQRRAQRLGSRPRLGLAARKDDHAHWLLLAAAAARLRFRCCICGSQRSSEVSPQACDQAPQPLLLL